MTIITVEGSHGQLLVHAATGYVIEADGCECCECKELGDYRSIAFFDPAHWDDCAVEHGCTDILRTAFVDRKGRYEPAMQPVLIGDVDMPDYYLDVFKALPAPQGDVA